MKEIFELIKRNTPDIADCFIFEKTDSDNGLDVYEYESVSGKILLRGNNTISLACAYYDYLKKYCGAHKTWCGEFELDIKEAPLPKEKYRHTIPQKNRVFLDYITGSNNTWLWDKDRWEKEIDFMAMNGINMALNTVGNDTLLFYTLVKMDFPESEALSFVSGPAFYAWQMTKKVHTYLPHGSFRKLEDDLVTAKWIVDRMKSLGITPILSTFSGLVPKTITKLYRQMKYYVINGWAGFNKTYNLNVDDELFKQFFKKYMQLQEEHLGTSTHYMCNQLCNYHEKSDRKRKKYMLSAGESFDRLMNFCCDNTPCLVFPSEGVDMNFLSRIEKCDTLIFDIDGSLHDKMNNFYPYNFVLGNTHQNSPHCSLRGDIEKVASNEFLSLSKNAQNLTGVGLFPESIDQNPLYYELSLEILTSNDIINLEDWIKDYTKRRYKSDSKDASEAVCTIAEICYSPENSKTDVGSTLCARPTPDIRHTAPFDRIAPVYDNKKLLYACKKLLSSGCKGKNFEYDLVFSVRQLLDNYSYSVYKQIMKDYGNRDKESFEKHAQDFLSIIDDVDTLLLSLPMTNSYDIINDIKKLAKDNKEESFFIINYLANHTVWGPMTEDSERYDCNWICISSLMKEYYRPRWDKFFENLLTVFGKIGIQAKSTKQINDRDQYTYSQFYRDMARFEQGVLLKFNPVE